MSTKIKKISVKLFGLAVLVLGILLTYASLQLDRSPPPLGVGPYWIFFLGCGIFLLSIGFILTFSRLRE